MTCSAAEVDDMNKWRFLVGGVSLAQLAWGVLALAENSRSVDGAGADGWVFSGLGLAGFLALAVPRAGYPVAVGQLAVAAYSLWCCGMLVMMSSALPWWVMPPGVLALFAMAFGMLALLCGLNAIGSWQVARRTGRCT
jgi:hypothetical protein